ncbi:MAG: SagB/ThcOx family dehydrogenase [Candidatus Omnitrophota bacterium]
MKQVLSVFLIFFSITMCAFAATLSLPNIKVSSDKPLIELLEKRQSNRQFKTNPLSLEQISLILWAAAGKKIDSSTSASRTTASAGALYPIEVYLYAKANGIKNLSGGLYKYLPQEHGLELFLDNLNKKSFVESCWKQEFVAESPVVIIVCAYFAKTTEKYGERGNHYVYLDAGHVGQNIYLMATQLNLSTVEIGAFDDLQVANCLKLDKKLTPIIIMPIGYKK